MEPILDEEAVFGEHNVSATTLGIGRLLENFPWDTYFSARGFSDPYPMVLYANDDADRLFEAMSDTLGALAADTDASFGFCLTFSDEGSPPQPVGLLLLEFNIPLLSKHRREELQIDDEHFSELLSRAAAISIAGQESYGQTVSITRLSSFTYRLTLK